LNKNTGIYIHIPFCRRKCNYCDFYVITNKTLISRVTQNIINEIRLASENYSNITFKTIYIGGGTPSIIPFKELEKIIDSLHKYLDISEIDEFTIEVNPEDICKDKDLIRNYAESGINRISLGIQSLNNSDLKFLSREHDRRQALKSIEKCKKYYNNISADIIYSLPTQNDRSITYSVKKMVELKIPHISAYTLTYEPETIIYKKLIQKKLSMKPDSKAEKQYFLISNFLIECGYQHYEVSNYSIPGYQSKHNLNYWDNGEYIGFGPSAHSHFGGKRWNNHKNTARYNIELQENKLPYENFHTLSKTERETEYIMLKLRSGGIDTEEYGVEFRKDFKNHYKSYIKVLTENSYARYEKGRFKLMLKGYSIADEIILSFTSKIY